MELADFCLFDCSYKGAYFSLYPAYSEKRRASVLIKVPKGIDAGERLKAEHDAAARWNAPGLIRVLDLLAEQGTIALVLENFRGLPIKSVIREKIPLEIFLPLALELCHVVEGMHARGFAHNGLNAENVWVCGGNNELRVTGLDRAMEIGSSRLGENDAGADLLAVGRIFLRLLTGLEWGPESAPTGAVLKSSYGIPRPLADICAKLLASDPKKKYKSAYGLRSDMALCASQWASNRRLTVFPPGAHDASGQLRLPSRTLGREQELRKIAEAYREVEKGGSRVILISGNPGAGKTFLANEAGNAITARNGVFVAGKTERNEKAPPLQALLAALGENAGDHALDSPENTHPTDDPAGASPEERFERFRMLVKGTAERLVSDGRPLAIFLDDLQWAGPSTFSWMEELAGDFGLKRLLIIGALRTNEISGGHPLPGFLARMTGVGKCTVIDCPPLSTDVSAGLVASCLGAPPESCRGLAGLIFEKTSGYPLQTIQFIRRIFNSGLLRFNRRASKWQWDQEAVMREEKSVDGQGLASRLLDVLPAGTAIILSAAAMVGSSVATGLLGQILGESEEAVSSGLRPAEREGLIDMETRPGSGATCMVFRHDTIREAALSRLSDADSGRLRLKAGLTLKAGLNENPEGIFDCVNLLNGADPSEEPGAIPDLAALNVEAAKMASARGSFEIASQYVDKALDLLGPDAWARDAQISMEAHKAGALGAYMSAKYDEAIRLAGEVSGRAASFADRAWAAILVSKCHLVRGMDEEAAGEIVKALSSFGLSVPKSLASARMYMESRRIRKLLAGDGLKRAEELPEFNDPDFRAVLSMILHLVPPRRFTDQPFCRLATARALDLVLQKGLCPEAAAIFALYAFGLRFYEEDVAEAYRVGTMALRLKDRFPPSGESVFVDFYVNLMAKPWGEHMRGCLDGFRAAFDTAMERGNLEFAAQSAFCLVYTSFFSGVRLDELHSEGSRLLERIRVFGRRGVDVYLRIILQAVENFMGWAPETQRLNGEMFSEEAQEASVLGSGDLVAMGVLRVFQTICSLFFGSSRQTLILVDEARKYIHGTNGTVAEAVANWYCSISLLQSLGSGGRQSARVVAGLDEFRKKLAHWAEFAPMNYQHRFDLIEAEVHRVNDRLREAANCYGLSAERARKGGFVHVAALAHELAAKFHIINGMKDEARLHFIESRNLYLTWGANGKVADLDGRLGNAFMLGAGPG